MMKKSNLFGVAAIDLDAARASVEHVLSAVMEMHESEYRGGDYFLLEKEGAKLVLQTNFTEDDGEVTEAEYPDAGILLYVDGESNAVDGLAALIMERLSLFRLLRTSSY